MIRYTLDVCRLVAIVRGSGALPGHGSLRGRTDTALSDVSGVSATPLLGETIGASLERAVARFRDREALVDVATGRRWTYGEFDAAVNEVALGLPARGIGWASGRRTAPSGC